MDPRASQDDNFRILPCPTPGEVEIAVWRPDASIRPGTAVVAGTTYSASELPLRPFVETWGDYVAAEAVFETGGQWQKFVKQLPTTPTVTERIDPLWGKVYDHTYRDLITNPTPERADDFAYTSEPVVTTGAVAVVTTGAVPVVTSATRKVLDVKTQDLGQGLNQVVVTTVANAQITVIDQPIDPETGTPGTDTKVFTLTATAPAAAAIDANALFTEVLRQEHNLWLARTRNATTLPRSRATAKTWDDTGKIYWPAVLESYQFTPVVAASLDRWVKLLSYSLRHPHAEPVKRTNRLWWQQTAPEVVVPTAMLPGGINIRGNLMSIGIDDCLHGAFTYEEHNFTAELGAALTSPQAKMIAFQYGATPLTDWPESVTILEVTPAQGGGYLCHEQTYYRPESYNTSTLTVSERDWEATDGIYYPVT